MNGSDVEHHLPSTKKNGLSHLEVFSFRLFTHQLDGWCKINLTSRFKFIDSSNFHVSLPSNLHRDSVLICWFHFVTIPANEWIFFEYKIIEAIDIALCTGCCYSPTHMRASSWDKQKTQRKFICIRIVTNHSSMPLLMFQMHRRALQLEEAKPDLSPQHVAKSHHSRCLLAVRSIPSDRRMRHQSDNKGLGIGSVSGQREQLRRYRYRWIQRTQICSQLRCKSLTTHKTIPLTGSALHFIINVSLFSSLRPFRRPASTWYRWAHSTTTSSTSSIGSPTWRLPRTKSVPKSSPFRSARMETTSWQSATGTWSTGTWKVDESIKSRSRWWVGVPYWVSCATTISVRWHAAKVRWSRAPTPSRATVTWWSLTRDDSSTSGSCVERRQPIAWSHLPNSFSWAVATPSSGEDCIKADKSRSEIN